MEMFLYEWSLFFARMHAVTIHSPANGFSFAKVYDEGKHSTYLFELKDKHNAFW